MEYLTVGQILGYVTQIATDWGILPFLSAGLIVTVSVGAFVALRRLMQGS